MLCRYRHSIRNADILVMPLGLPNRRDTADFLPSDIGIITAWRGTGKSCVARRGAIRSSGRRGAGGAWQVTLGGRQVGVPRLQLAQRGGLRWLPSFQWVAATDPLDEHTLSAVAARVSTAAVCGHIGPGAGRADGARDVEQRGVSSVRGAVGQAPAVVSQPAGGRAGPAGGLHRRQGLPGPLHGGCLGDQRTANRNPIMPISLGEKSAVSR